MATEMPITLYEGNNETLLVTIDRETVDADLLTIAVVELYLKTERCDLDSAALVLSSTVPAELVILTHTAEQITAEVYVPPLTGSYTRWYRVDGVSASGDRRTAVFGPAYVTDL